ncbi:Oidioi.mRNA.OKI2018_I69.PAR.g12756.t1.cds [Oikopleura dioica]|uniref:Oidioi.mRNA.OKI2018_I69.PAR.g12756.t1.cds n=1 Tax=Oikopleura dioica TaxID=34765 RepID=A0ABN7S8H8_OIKDI|nr:Oidioi.mRNA.OKI2018_I69.PAR.g12756.t1.cds [Oikopleura dioica]
MTPDEQTSFVQLFIVSVLAFSSNLFFAKLGFQIQTHPPPSPIPAEERALYWLLRRHQEAQRAASAESECQVPGVSDDPPKYCTVMLPPSYSSLSINKVPEYSSTSDTPGTPV